MTGFADLPKSSRGLCRHEGCSKPIVGRFVVQVRRAVPKGNGTLIASTSRSYCEQHCTEAFQQASEAMK